MPRPLHVQKKPKRVKHKLYTNSHVIVVLERIPTPIHKPTRPTTKFRKVAPTNMRRQDCTVVIIPTVKSNTAKIKGQLQEQKQPFWPPPLLLLVRVVVVVVCRTADIFDFFCSLFDFCFENAKLCYFIQGQFSRIVRLKYLVCMVLK